MDFVANGSKNVEIETSTGVYLRHAIQTHFVEIGEDYIELVNRYVKPLYEQGDLLSISEKIIALCQKRVVYRKDMKISWLAKFLSRFAIQHNSAGIGVGEVCKMQFAIDICGPWKVLWAAICAGFGMRVLAYDKFPSPDSGLSYVTLPELLAQSDVVSLHCPLTSETRHMIGAAAIAGMKTGVVIVNTSRGALIDTEALIDGLKRRKIGAACLDVYEEESELFYEDRSDSIIEDDVLVRLISMPNVIVTSHQAFLTKEALNNIAATTVDNLLKFRRGEPAPETEVCFRCAQ